MSRHERGSHASSSHRSHTGQKKTLPITFKYSHYSETLEVDLEQPYDKVVSAVKKKFSKIGNVRSSHIALSENFRAGGPGSSSTPIHITPIAWPAVLQKLKTSGTIEVSVLSSESASLYKSKILTQIPKSSVTPAKAVAYRLGSKMVYVLYTSDLKEAKEIAKAVFPQLARLEIGFSAWLRLDGLISDLEEVRISPWAWPVVENSLGNGCVIELSVLSSTMVSRYARLNSIPDYKLSVARLVIFRQGSDLVFAPCTRFLEDAQEIAKAVFSRLELEGDVGFAITEDEDGPQRMSRYYWFEIFDTLGRCPVIKVLDPALPSYGAASSSAPTDLERAAVDLLTTNAPNEALPVYSHPENATAYRTSGTRGTGSRSSTSGVRNLFRR